ncbi:MAG: hypothetical protein KBG15_22545 [Kofleriaceae bacterium]|nr:hypothetical protein [Kofleriaceae bacterium]
MRAVLIATAMVGWLWANAGCGVNQSKLDVRTDAAPSTPDSNESFDGAATIDAAPDARVCANGRVLFLNFNGVTITAGPMSDARQNQASWIAATVNVPAYRAGQATRATMITDITNLTRASLAMFPVTVVTTRPVSGEYIMITFGGDGTLFGFANTTPAITGFNCGAAARNGIGWVADANTAQQAANVAIGATGISLGLTGIIESKSTDCLCGWGGTACVPDITQACTLSTAVLRNTNNCPADPASQNEVAAFDQGFCKP